LNTKKNSIKYPSSFDSDEIKFLRAIFRRTADLSLKMKCLRLLAMKAMAVISLNLTEFNHLGARSNWKWSDGYFFPLNHIFEVCTRRSYHGNQNPDFSDSGQRVLPAITGEGI
jgi:hypothetical protein